MESMQRNTEATLMLWSEDSLASHSATPACSKERKIPAFMAANVSSYTRVPTDMGHR